MEKIVEKITIIFIQLKNNYFYRMFCLIHIFVVALNKHNIKEHFLFNCDLTIHYDKLKKQSWLLLEFSFPSFLY